MRLSSATLIIFAVLFISGHMAHTQAQDRQGASYSGANNRSSQGVRFGTTCKPVRVDDKGRPLVLWNQQVVYRALNNTNVYLYEGRATVREEVAGWGVIFHTQGNGVRPGHIYHTRDN